MCFPLICLESVSDLRRKATDYLLVCNNMYLNSGLTTLFSQTNSESFEKGHSMEGVKHNLVAKAQSDTTSFPPFLIMLTNYTNINREWFEC